MTITTEAIYEQGILRPVQPIPLAEGEQVEVIIVSEQEAGQGVSLRSLGSNCRNAHRGQSTTLLRSRSR